MRRLATKLLRDHAGATALTFALLTPILVLLAGGAVDITNASMRQSNLQQAADAAAVGAVSRYSPGYQAALQMTANGPVSDSITATNDQAIFNANRNASSDTTVTALAGSACGGATIVCKNGTTVQSKVTVTGTFTTSFLGLIAQPSIKLAATSQATASIPTYINYYIIVDTSQSMGIAATATDMQNLYNRVITYKNSSGKEAGCVFGCHVKEEDAYNYTTNTYDQSLLQTYTNEDLAHNLTRNFGPYITLRIDSAVTAIQSIISQAQQYSGANGNIKIGLYEMNHAPSTSTYYTKISDPSSNYSGLTTLAAAIDLGNNNQKGYGDTDFDDELTSFQSLVPSNGTGLTPLSPLNYVFIVTDGLSDNSGNTVNNHPTSAFNQSDCTVLKANATVGVIYTTYTPIYNNNNVNSGFEGNYAGLVAPYTNAIPTNLQACTSDPSLYYFEASDGPALISAMQRLFAQTQKTARLSQ